MAPDTIPPPGWSGPQSAAPSVGELILLKCDVRNVHFPWGPASRIALSNAGGSAVSATRTTVTLANVGATAMPPPQGPQSLSIPRARGNRHMFLVLDVAPSGLAILLPVFAYSRPPSQAVPPPSWDADRWMRTQATTDQRRHHIPIPATLPNGQPWIPPPHPSGDAPAVSFGPWLNSRPAWLIMTDVTVRFDTLNMPVWFRKTANAIQVDDPSVLLRLQTYVRSILPLELSPPITHGDGHDVTTFPFVMPDSQAVWRRIFGHDADSIDPVGFWNFAGAPERLRQAAVEHVQAEQTRRILTWDDGAHSGIPHAEKDIRIRAGIEDDWARNDDCDDNDWIEQEHLQALGEAPLA